MKTLTNAATVEMSKDNPDTLDQIAEQIGEIVEEQDEDHRGDSYNESSEDFDPEEYRRSREEYEGGWETG